MKPLTEQFPKRFIAPSLRRLAISLLALAMYVAVTNACGPFFREAVFVNTMGPDGSYAAYVGGRLGVPQPGYRMRHLVVAYDWLNGNGLSAGEQQQALAVDAFLNPAPGSAPPLDPVAEAYEAWIAAHAASGAPGGKQPPASVQATRPDTRRSLDSFGTERLLPGEPYQYFGNCLADAFATAATTLAARRAEHAAAAAAIADWVQGQDAVFANCDGQRPMLPDAVPGDSPVWLKQDRAYQRAAASFYQTDYDAAIAQLQAIAADAASPWNHTARLVMARAMIRRATVGQGSELSAGAAAVSAAPYSQEWQNLLNAYQQNVAAKRTARLAEAQQALQAIVADPAMTSMHHSAQGLLDFVALKLNPAAQARVLEQRLAAPARSQTPGVFRQALIDIRYYPQGAEPELPPSSSLQPHPTQSAEPGAGTGLLAWVRAMFAAVHPVEGGPGSSVIDDQELAAEARRKVQARDNALAGWRGTHATPWLLAALATSDPGDPAVPGLVQAASALPAHSPGTTAATYYRLRFAPDQQAARAELSRLLPTFARTESRSTINLFLMLRQQSAPTLHAFLSDAGTIPAGDSDEDEDAVSPLDTKPTDGLCHLHGGESETQLFDHVAATILNTRMPLRLLAEAAASDALPLNLRFQVAQAAWTRAVLLGQPAIAKRMSPLLIGCYLAWQPVLAKYDDAADATDREANGLLALMRFASTEPMVREGAQRPEGFATYSRYRDNWWLESRARRSVASTPSASGYYVLGRFFGTLPASGAELPDPPFLTAADQDQASSEIAALRRIPCSSDYFAAAALRWQQVHPTDPRTPDILGYAERAVRAGCHTDATSTLNHQLFTVVQTRYSKSEWAAKYKTWE